MKIQTEKEYESVKDLAHMLEKLHVTDDFESHVVYEYGGDFEECDGGCCSVINECSCERDMEYSNPYSDEESFE